MIEELRVCIAEMSFYLWHESHCSLLNIPGCDTCTCGMAGLKKRARELYENTKGISIHDEGYAPIDYDAL